MGKATYHTIVSNFSFSKGYTYYGHYFYLDGTYKVTLTNKAGCDSIVNLVLSSGANPSSIMYDTICDGQSYYFNGKILTKQGGYTSYIPNHDGTRDSIILLALYVRHDGKCVNSEIAPGTPINLNITTTNDSITWTGQSARYRVFYKSITDKSWKFFCVRNNRAMLKGLAPDYSYVCFVANYNADQRHLGYTSGIDTVHTRKPCDKPTGLTLSNPTCFGFTATWDSIPGVTRYIIKVQYDLGNKTYKNSGWSTTNRWVTTHMPKGDNITVAIYAMGCNGGAAASPISDAQTISTLSDPSCPDHPIDTAGRNGSNGGGHNGGYHNGCGCNMADVPYAATTQTTIFPNPNSGQFTVEMISNNLTDDAQMVMMNAMGQVVMTVVIPNNNGTFQQNIQTGNLPAGVYLVKLRVGDEIHNEQVIIQ
jgi:hypothetical protein